MMPPIFMETRARETFWPRRNFIWLMAGAGVVGALGGQSCQKRPPAADRTWWQCPDPMHPSLEVFRDLSACCTGVEDLPENAVQKLFELFGEEPWGWKHVGTAYVQLAHTAEAHPGKSLEDVMALTPWRDGEAWFVQHLAITWWTGIYYRENQLPRMVLGREALCWTQTDLAPGWVAHGPENWGRPR